MTTKQEYANYTKKAWIIYSLITIAVVVVLVLFVAQDNEERFFYGLMPAAAAYVLRPSDRLLDKYILKFTGVSRPKSE
ncbi:hypothetical protein MNBD_GAMMA06-982 [hydrothermal vent metagenome]|uniref:Uncharacterized protein n=1 Tax=hydrothermal vent metagenome TaxID=652676 RepID=A0A3B0WNT0_9ZZZZ